MMILEAVSIPGVADVARSHNFQNFPLEKWRIHLIRFP